MCLVAVKQPYVLQIMYDEDGPNSRVDYDNFGKMMCWHSRYNLGDEHDHRDPRSFLEQLVTDSIPPKDIVAYVKDGKADDVKLEYDRAAHAWTVTSYDNYFKKWFTDCTFEGKLQDGIDKLAEGITGALYIKDLLELAQQKNCILEVNLYDHSILRMSTSSFIGRAQHAEWDSGQVGWIYASHEDVKNEYGSITPEALEKTENLLRVEVETYNCYLSNQCYGFRLYKDGAEEDSCWGFLGCIDDVKQDIAVHLPEECRSMVDDMEDIEDRDFDDYLYADNELDEEMEAI